MMQILTSFKTFSNPVQPLCYIHEGTTSFRGNITAERRRNAIDRGVSRCQRIAKLLHSPTVEYVATFSSTHRVLRAEKLLKARGVPFKLYPSPKVLIAPSQCGLVIAFYSADMEAFREALYGERTRPKAVYRKAMGGAYIEV